MASIAGKLSLAGNKLAPTVRGSLSFCSLPQLPGPGPHVGTRRSTIRALKVDWPGEGAYDAVSCLPGRIGHTRINLRCAKGLLNGLWSVGAQ